MTMLWSLLWSAHLLQASIRFYIITCDLNYHIWQILYSLLSDGDQEEGPCPAECPPGWGRPVCASDGKLYRSSCAFRRARCQEPFLEARPRFRCAGLSQRDNNHANFTRCQEDRAAALAKSRRQPHATYIPECSEDGAFLQVQCHKQTGYCWCSNLEGKPISGTTVLNETPNCTGTEVVGISWQSHNSSRQEEGARPRPTQPSPRPPKQEGTSLSFLIPIILPELKPNHTVKQAQASPPSCEQERQAALREARQQEGTFIPDCEGGGTYKEVQCHQATGYCWCVRVDTGQPVPGTSTRKFPPDCEADAAAARSTETGFLFRDRMLPGCPGAKKAEFLRQLIQVLVSHMLQSRVMTIPYQRFPDSLAAPSLDERAVRWHFAHLDRDLSSSLSGRELRPLKRYLKRHARPKRCVRRFLDYCDLNGNNLVSLPEFRGCLGLS